jgi:hypothetical protein
MNKDIVDRVENINIYDDILTSPHPYKKIIPTTPIDTLGETSLACW